MLGHTHSCRFAALHSFGGIDDIKMVKAFAGFPIVFVGLAMVFGFIMYMAKRPRDINRNYLYEDEVANAPDSGAPEAKRSALWERIRARWAGKAE